MAFSNYNILIIFLYFFSITKLAISLPIGTMPSSYKAFIRDEYPSNEYDYMKARDLLLKTELEYEQRTWKLTPDEQIVDHYLSYLKFQEMENTKHRGFPPSRPIEEQLDYIKSTKLYELLKKMPKGGILHSHEDHQVSRRILFDIIWNSDDFDHLFIINPNSTENPWQLNFFINPPEGENWIKVSDSNISKEEIIKKNTLLGLMTFNASRYPTDSDMRWSLINLLWTRSAVQLISNIKIKSKYLIAMFEQGLSEGVTYFETRRGIGIDLPIYILDRSSEYNSTHGKKFIDDNSAELEINLAKSLAKNFIAEHSEFIGHKRISYTVRQNNEQDFLNMMNNVVRIHQKYPEHIIGFDAVGEEDAGHSTLYHLDEYLSLNKNRTTAIPLYLHNGETNWPDDLIFSDYPYDPIPTAANVYDTILLNVRRIGHAVAFNKHPFLKQILKEKKIAVELCPISNQILGVTPDLRNHYGQNFYREGIPITISPDDPGTFGYDHVTVDWYAIYTSWGLNLGDLKKIALNSLTYSGMEEQEKTKAIRKKWHPSWDVYILKVKGEACNFNFDNNISRNNIDEPFINVQNIYNVNTSFAKIYPKEGSLLNITNVHLYGGGFEKAICKTIICMFGTLKSSMPGKYISNRHIVCYAPKCIGCSVNTPVSIFVQLDGSNFIDTKLRFTYMFN